MKDSEKTISVPKHEKLDAIIDEVKQTCASNLSPDFYGFSYPDEFESVDKNLFDTPHGYWNTTTPLPNKHSDRFHFKITEMLSKSMSQVDIVTMDLPRENLNSAIQWGVFKALDNSPALRVRILCGCSYKGLAQLDTAGYIRQFIAQLKEWGTDTNKLKKLHLFVASQDYNGGAGWNHGKLIISDLKEVIFGGHNMWGNDYMERNPVFDLSIALKGDVALDGTYYADELWKFVKNNNHHNLVSKTYSNSFTVSDSGTITINQNAPTGVFGRVRVPLEDKGVKALYLAQPGMGLIDHDATRNPIFVATNYAFKYAKYNINLIQQDLGSGRVIGGRETGNLYPIRGGFKCIQFNDYKTNTCHAFYFDVLYALAHALKSKLRPTLSLVLTNNGGGYSNGLTWCSIYRALGFMLHKVYKLSKEETEDILKKNVFVRHIAFQGSQQWKDGNKNNIAIHTKYWEVDGKVVSVGSFNLYPSVQYLNFQTWTAYLNEISIVLSGDKVVSNLRSEYFDKVWRSSIAYIYDPVLMNNLPEFGGMDSVDEEMVAMLTAAE